MAHQHITKVRSEIRKLKRHMDWKKKAGVAAASLILILGAIWWMALPLPQNYETEIPAMAKSYSATPISIDCADNTGCQIQLKFNAAEPAQKIIPKLSRK